MVWLVVAFVVCAVIAGVIAPSEPNIGFKDSASLLAWISLTAVAIERIIEGFFTVITGRAGEWWPLSVVRAEFDTFEQETNAMLGPVVRTTLDELEAAKAVAGKSEDEIRRIQDLIDGIATEQQRLQSQLGDVTTKLVPGSDRLARVGEINSAMAATLHRAHEQTGQYTTSAQQALKTAGDAADRASLIIASFQDNPARRVASLALGTSLGMLVAGGVGLNLFVATLVDGGGTAGGALAVVTGGLGVVLTGIIIGLGAAPTHEVVKSLQAYKDSRTAPVAVTTMTTGEGAVTSSIQEAIVLEAFDGTPSAIPVGETPASLRVRMVRRSS